MMERFRGFAIIAAAAVAATGFSRDWAYAQSADLVLCDRVAADPADPDKPADAKGVADIAASDIATAIKFCKSAANSSRRAMYQLGRAYAANRQTAEAIGGLAQGGRQGLDLGHGRTRRALRDRRGRRARRGAGAQTVRARGPGRQSARHQQPRRSRRRSVRPIRRGRANCCRRPRRPMPRRSISSA